MESRIARYLSKIEVLESVLGAATSYRVLEPFAWKRNYDEAGLVLDIQLAGRRISDFLNLGDLAFVVSFCKQSDGIAGHIELAPSQRDVFVEIDPALIGHPDTVLATLSHEIAHKVLHNRGIRLPDESENELLTDIAGVYLGLGKLMLNGCESAVTRHDRATNTETVSTYKCGYIDRADLAFVYLVVSFMRGLPPTAYETNLSPDALSVVRGTRGAWPILFACGSAVEREAALWSSIQKCTSGIQQRLAEHDRNSRILSRFVTRAEDSSSQLHKTVAALAGDVGAVSEQPNPHLRFLKLASTYDSICCQVSTLGALGLPTSNLSEVARLIHEDEGLSSEIIDCPVDRTKLRVPAGKHKLLVTCPTCHYAFLVMTSDSQTRGSAPRAPRWWHSRFRPLRSGRLAIVKGKAVLQRAPLPWKVISALVLCCALAAASFWAYHSRKATGDIFDRVAFTEPAKSSQPSASTPPQVTWDDAQVRSAAPSGRGVPPAKRSLPTYSAADVEITPAGGLAGAGQVRPETGMNIIRVPGQRGHGTLRINNGIGRDATVKLVNVSTGKPIRWVYIRSSDETTMKNIAPGSCRVRFAIGNNWDKTLRKFRDDRSYSEFDDSLDFRETETADKVNYATFEITLHPVVGGTARTDEISEAQFEQDAP